MLVSRALSKGRNSETQPTKNAWWKREKRNPSCITYGGGTTKLITVELIAEMQGLSEPSIETTAHTKRKLAACQGICPIYSTKNRELRPNCSLRNIHVRTKSA